MPLRVSTFGTVEYWFSLIKITAIVAFILLAAYVIASDATGTMELHNATPRMAAFCRTALAACGSRSSWRFSAT